MNAEAMEGNDAVAGQVERPVRPRAWAVVYDDVTHGVCLTEVAAKLWVENLLEQNRGRGFDFRVMPLYWRDDIEGSQQYGWTPSGMIEDDGAGEYVNLREVFGA